MTQRAVLLMDDDPRVVRALTKALECSDHRLFAAATLGEAFRILGEHGPEIDLVITELEPRVQGMLRAIQAACKSLPVLVVTASGDRDVYARAMACGAAEFLNKPIRAAELRALLKRFCPSLCFGPSTLPLTMAA